MSSIYQRPVSTTYCMVVTCGVRSCGKQRTSPTMTMEGYGPRPREHDEFFRDLSDEGWTFWHGRMSFAYCPDHGPRPGHRMCRWEPYL